MVRFLYSLLVASICSCTYAQRLVETANNRSITSSIKPLFSELDNSVLATEVEDGPTFWVVNFGTAKPLKKKRFGFAAGMGGQMVFLGDPTKTSAFFTIPHAGFRYGVSNRVDIGLRLAPIPLPFATVGPGFGVNLDGKILLTKPNAKVDFAAVVGFGGAHVLIEDVSRFAYSPNFALLNSYKINEATYFTIMARYVHLAITTALGGSKANFVNISGVSFGLKKEIRPNISLLPEIGTYLYQGKILGVSKNGIGLQYGMMISTSF
jgi:hypothetical protein